MKTVPKYEQEYIGNKICLSLEVFRAFEQGNAVALEIALAKRDILSKSQSVQESQNPMKVIYI